MCIGLFLSACSSGDAVGTSRVDLAAPSASSTPAAPADGSEPNSGEVPFALFEGAAPDEGWRLTEAVQPSADAMEFYREITPGMAWYAEWDGPGGSASSHLSLTMIASSLADLDSRDPLSGAFTGEIKGRPASWGENLNGGDFATTTVRIEWNPRWSFELRGTEPAETMLSFARRLHPATKQEWRAAGGQVGCRPFAEKCDG